MDQNIRNKLNEIRQKQLESKTNSQSNKPSTTSNDKSPKIGILLGVAVGFITAWLMSSLFSTEDVNLIGQDSHVAIHENEIREANKTIEQLNDRVELLTDSISSLESELTHTIELIEHNKNDEKTNSTHQDIPEPADEKPITTLADSQTSGVTDSTVTSETPFIPTHVVKTRLNLRRTTSLNDAPIGVLSTGTEVSYIDEANGWYYIDTEQLGQGWCASEFLSPLSSP